MEEEGGLKPCHFLGSENQIRNFETQTPDSCSFDVKLLLYEVSLKFVKVNLRLAILDPGFRGFLKL